ncbi:MAG: hypothetical protein II912_12105 [Clostridia bacterium]|nr:hypothetical protein [Clostridia bacterium]
MKSKTDTASFRALLRMAGRILGCILASAALLTDLSALPGSSGTAFTRYVADSVFYDTLLAAACFGLAYVLTGRAQAEKGSAHTVLAALFMALAAVLSSLFSGADVRFDLDMKRLIVIAACFAGYAVLFRALCVLMGGLLDRAAGPGTRPGSRRYALIVFLCAVPYLIVTFPGTVNADAYDQLNQFMGTLYPGQVFSRTAAVSMFPGSGTLINDTQPVLHTLLLGGFYALGRAAGSGSLGVFAFVLIQSALGALAVGRALSLLEKTGLSGRAAGGLKWFYALFPLFPLYMCATLKDTAFAIALLHALCFAAELILFPQNCMARPARLLRGGLAVLLTGLFRSFGLAVLLPIMIYALAKASKARAAGFGRALACVLCGFVSCLIVLYAVCPLAGVGKGPGIEKRALMVQQTALFVKEHPQEVTQSEWETIESVFGTREISEMYRPDNADEIKYLALEYRGSWNAYTQAWLGMGLRRPGTYLRAALGMAARYWDIRLDATDSGTVLYMGDYGRYEYGVSGEFMRMTPGYVEIHVSDTGLKLVNLAKSALLAVSRLPVIGLLFKSGPYLLSLIALTAWMLKNKRQGVVFPVTFILYGLALTLSARSGFSRYAFPLMLTIPFMTALCAVMPEKKRT